MFYVLPECFSDCHLQKLTVNRAIKDIHAHTTILLRFTEVIVISIIIALFISTIELFLLE